MKNTKFFLQSLFILFLLFGYQFSYAAEEIKLTLKHDGDVVFYGIVPLPPARILDVNDSNGNPHEVDSRSVLYVVDQADLASSNFNISDLRYYPSFGAFYLKCITTDKGNELCDNWQYRVDNDYPSVGMDNKILTGGENVLLYFGEEELPVPNNTTYTFTPPSVPFSVPLPVPENVVNNFDGVAPTEEIPVSVPLVLLPDTGQTKIEEVKKLETNEIFKTVVKKEKKKNLEKKEIQNRAEAITAVTSLAEKEPILPPVKHKSWFRKFLGRIFNF